MFVPISYVQSSGHSKNLTNTCIVNEHILAFKDLTIVAIERKEIKNKQEQKEREKEKNQKF